MSRNVGIYHKNCFDGICSAWILNKRFPGILLHPMAYGEKLPWDIARSDQVYMVDFSLPAKELQELALRVEYLTVIDHHKTAQENLQDFVMSNVTIKFDMTESGASLAWKYFFPNHPVPKLVQYIRAADIWDWGKLEWEREITAWIRSYPMDIAIYENLFDTLESESALQHAMGQGAAIERYRKSLVEQIVKYPMIEEIAGFKAAVVNCPVLMSEVGHELAKVPGVDFGAYYFDRADGMTQWGARSIGDFDVSEIAKKFGGGGHKNAAGWQIPIGDDK